MTPGSDLHIEVVNGAAAMKQWYSNDPILLPCCIDSSAKLSGEGHGTSADRVARVELACADFPPDGIEQLGEAIKRIGVQLSVGVSGVACLRPQRSRALS